MANASIIATLTNAANANGVPPALLLAQAQQESSLNPNAYNPKSGATGLLQLEPGTAADYGVTDPTDPVQNANAGANYLADLYNEFGDWATALAAYDWGPGNVSKYGTASLPAETQNYVSTILGNAGMDATASVTPSSVANGISDLLTPAPADDSGSVLDSSGDLLSLSASSGPSLATIALIGLAAFAAWDLFLRQA